MKLLFRHNATRNFFLFFIFCASFLMGCSDRQEVMSDVSNGYFPALNDKDIQRHVFFSIAQSHELIAVAGEEGQVWLSSDNGNTWTPRATGVSFSLTSITFSSAESIWAIGPDLNIVRSINGGKTWEKKKVDIPGSSGFAPSQIAFVDKKTGYIGGNDSRVLQTIDGGESWTYVEEFRYLDNPITWLKAFPSSDVLVLTKNGQAFLKQGGGAWTEIYQGRDVLLGALQLGDGHYLLYGAGGLLVETVNGGKEWTKFDSIPASDLYAGAVMGDGSIILAGNRGLMLRREKGQYDFVMMDYITQGAILGLDTQADGGLIFVGQWGVGKIKDSKVEFFGKGPTGTLFYENVSELFLTKKIADVSRAIASTRLDSGEAIGASWLQADVGSNSSEHKSLLDPANYTALEHLSSQLPYRSTSLWNTHMFTGVSVNFRGVIEDMTDDLDDYDEDAEKVLRARLSQAGHRQSLLSDDGSIAHFYIDDFEPYLVSQNGDDSEGDLLQNPFDTLLDKNLSVKLTKLDKFKLVGFDLSEKPGRQGSARHVDGPVVAYSVSYKPWGSKGTYLNNLSALLVADELAFQLRKNKDIGAVLTVADHNKWEAGRHGGAGWRSFIATGSTGGYEDHGMWGDVDKSGISTVAILYSRAPEQNLASAITNAITASLERTQSDLRPYQFSITAYTLTKTDLLDEVAK